MTSPMKMEPGPQQSSCPKCGKTVKGNYELRKHMRSHGEEFLEVPAKSKQPKCPECDKTFSDNYCVKRHMQVHMKATTGVSPNVKRCPECDKTFSDNYGVRRHMQVHGKSTDVPVTCKICDKVFHSTNMSRHLKIHKEKNGKNYGTINVGENLPKGENRDVVCETPLVISLSDNDDDNGVTIGHSEMESDKLSNYTSTAVSLCKSCSQCGKELRDKWALRRHMAMHAYSDGVRVQEASCEESPPKANEPNETANLDELFDPRSIDNEIEFLQKEAKKYRQGGEEGVKGQDEEKEGRQLTQNWQLPTQNTCEVFVQPGNHFLSGLPAMPGFQSPWNIGQKIQSTPAQNIQQENLGIYTPTQNIFGPTQNILAYSNMIPAPKLNIAGQSTGPAQDFLKQTQNLQILPYPGYSFQYVSVPAKKSQDVPIAMASPIAVHHPSKNLQPRFEKEESSHPVEQIQGSKVCHLCDKKFQSNYNVRRHLKTHSNEDISCPGCGNRFKTTEYLTKHSKICTFSKVLQKAQNANNSVQDRIPRSMVMPQLDEKISSENTSEVLPAPKFSPSLPLSAGLQYDVLEKFAQVDKIVEELQQLAY